MELHDRPYRTKGTLALRTLMLLWSMYAPSARWHTVLTTYAISMAVCEARGATVSVQQSNRLDARWTGTYGSGLVAGSFADNEKVGPVE